MIWAESAAGTNTAPGETVSPVRNSKGGFVTATIQRQENRQAETIAHKPQPVPAGLAQTLQKNAWRLEYTRTNSIFDIVWIGLGGLNGDLSEMYVGTFGDGDNAAYEWFFFQTAAKTAPCKLVTSNCGYGCHAVALRDGLKANDV